MVVVVAAASDFDRKQRKTTMKSQVLNVYLAVFCLIGTAFSFQWRKLLHVSILCRLLFWIRSLKWNWNWVKRKLQCRCGKCALNNLLGCGILEFPIVQKWTWQFLFNNPFYWRVSEYKRWTMLSEMCWK